MNSYSYNSTVISCAERQSLENYATSTADSTTEEKGPFFPSQKLNEKITQLSLFGNSENNSAKGRPSSRYEIHAIFPDSGTALMSPHNNSQQRIEKEKRLLSIIRSCYFEPGIWTEADDYFESLMKKNNYETVCPLSILSNIANHNLSDDHILEGILHILSYYSYEQIEPIGITVAIACAVNHSPVIQDLLLSCFEKWDAVDAIDILTSLKLSEEWLSAYRDDVVAQLLKKKQDA